MIGMINRHDFLNCQDSQVKHPFIRTDHVRHIWIEISIRSQVDQAGFNDEVHDAEEPVASIEIASTGYDERQQLRTAAGFEFKPASCTTVFTFLQ